MSARVTVVVRSRGAVGPLERAVASVRAQGHADWTLVVALPPGADGSAAERLAQGDDRISVVRAEGRGALANAALAAGAGDLAVLHDDDGGWDPSFLEATVAHLASHPDDVAVATRAEVVVDALDPAHPGLELRRAIAQDEPSVSLVSLIAHNFVPPASLVIRRSVLDELGGYDESLPALEDWELLLRLVAAGPVGFLRDKPLAAWHLTTDAAEHADAYEDVELALRDRYLREDLGGGAEGRHGLGAQLALAHQLRRLGKAHQDHLDVVTTDLRIELGRVRGEVLMMRETLTELQEDFVVLSDVVEDAMSRTVGLVDALRDEGVTARRRSLPRRAAGRAYRSLQARRGSGSGPTS